MGDVDRKPVLRVLSLHALRHRKTGYDTGRGRAAKRVLASPGGCRVVITETDSLAEIGDAGVTALLQLPERVQLLVTDLAEHYGAGDRLLARLLAHPRVQRLQTRYGQVWLETVDRAVRYADAQARFRAAWNQHIRLPAPTDPGAPEPGMPILTAVHHLFREEPPPARRRWCSRRTTSSSRMLRASRLAGRSSLPPAWCPQ